MNERIKELAEQAEQYAYRVAVGGDECQEAYTKKFANLIIQECVEICRKGINNATDWDSSYWDQACENRAETIQQHFGVEE
jgi:hypothetical protein